MSDYCTQESHRTARIWLGNDGKKCPYCRIEALEADRDYYKTRFERSDDYNQELKQRLEAVEGLQPRTVYLDPDRLELIQVVIYDELEAALLEKGDE